MGVQFEGKDGSRRYTPLSRIPKYVLGLWGDAAVFFYISFVEL